MNLKEILFQTYLIVLPVFMSYIVWMLKQQKKVRDANSVGTMLLIRIQLIEYHDKYCEIGHVPSYVCENYNDLYKAYKDLGGNGMIEHMKSEFDKLEIR